MKTIYLFGVIRNHKIVIKRVSDSKEKKRAEIHLATLRNQPKDYWVKMAAKKPNSVLLDPVIK